MYSLLLALLLCGQPLITSTAYATSDSHENAWYVGEWKTKPEDGMSIAVRFGANGKGVFGIYKNDEPIQTVNIVYSRTGDRLVFSRNDVEVQFFLDEASKTVKTGGGVPMTKISSDSGASGGCEEACWACNAGDKDLKAKYGSAEIPSQFRYAIPFAENQGYQAYQSCAQPYGMKAFTDPIISEKCSQKGHQACVEACNKAQ